MYRLVTIYLSAFPHCKHLKTYPIIANVSIKNCATVTLFRCYAVWYHYANLCCFYVSFTHNLSFFVDYRCKCVFTFCVFLAERGECDSVIRARAKCRCHHWRPAGVSGPITVGECRSTNRVALSYCASRFQGHVDKKPGGDERFPLFVSILLPLFSHCCKRKTKPLDLMSCDFTKTLSPLWYTRRWSLLLNKLLLNTHL